MSPAMSSSLATASTMSRTSAAVFWAIGAPAPSSMPLLAPAGVGVERHEGLAGNDAGRPRRQGRPACLSRMDGLQGSAGAVGRLLDARIAVDEPVAVVVDVIEAVRLGGRLDGHVFAIVIGAVDGGVRVVVASIV